jgi:hypothetical protein
MTHVLNMHFSIKHSGFHSQRTGDDRKCDKTKLKRQQRTPTVGYGRYVPFKAELSKPGISFGNFLAMASSVDFSVIFNN